MPSQQELLLSELRSIPFGLLERFKDKRILVSGATGLLGSTMVQLFALANREYGMGAEVFAQTRSLAKAKAVLGDPIETQGVNFVVADLKTDDIELESSLDYILHFASITSSTVMREHPVEVIETSLNGTRTLLELAAKNKTKFFYASSMEAYGVVENDGKSTEEELGFIDLTAPRSGYPESKRMCENMCYAYAQEFGVPVVIGRLAQTFGVGAQPSDNRAITAFVRQVLCGNDIVLHATGNSEANYVYITDALKAILMLLVDERGTDTFNISNEQCHMSINEMAELVVSTVSSKSKVVHELDPGIAAGFAPDTKLFLDASKLQGIGWRPEVDMAEGIRRLASYLQAAE